MQQIRQQCRRERQHCCDQLTSLFQRKTEVVSKPIVSQPCTIHNVSWDYTKALEYLKHRDHLNALDARMRLFQKRVKVLDIVLRVLDIPKDQLKTHYHTLTRTSHVLGSDEAFCQRVRQETIQMRFKKNI